MKRMMIVLLVGLLLLSLCGCGNSPATTDTAKTTEVAATQPTTMATEPSVTTTAPITTTPISENNKTSYGFSEEDAHERIAAFFDGWIDDDIETLKFYMGEQTAAKELAESVKLSGYTLTPQKDSGTDEIFRYSARLTVAESSIDRLPAGESDWSVWFGIKNDGVGIYLCPEGEDMQKQMRLHANSSWAPEYFCNEFSTTFKVFDTFVPNSLSKEEILAWTEQLMILRNRALHLTGRPTHDYNTVIPAEMADFVKTTFGADASGADFTKSELYDKELGVLYLPGKGGWWTYATLESVDTKDDRTTVVIRYCADDLCLLEAVTMRYEVERVGLDYRLLSCEKISGNREVAYGSI